MKGDIQRTFQEYGTAYIRDNRERLTEQHLKVIRAIQTCRTGAAGWIEFICDDCLDVVSYVERSCGNRMCPSCQSGKTAVWLDKRLREQLPVHYFLITFTVPDELCPFFIHSTRQGFTALFKAASRALKTLAGNPRFLGVDLPGFFGVLHTWGRTLNYHPHIHFVVPGGGLDKRKGLWRSTREDFFAPGQALAKVFKGIFRELVENEGLAPCIDPAVWKRKWVVDCQAAGRNSRGVINYLAPYVFKTAITDSRIVGTANGKVTFTYVKSGSRRARKMTLDAKEFIRRYLMHVLPNGFMRIRRYGFMGSGCSVPHGELVSLVRMAQAFEAAPVEYTPGKKASFLCPRCGGRMVARRIFDAKGTPFVVFHRFRPCRQ
jgi:hypothetical protein